MPFSTPAETVTIRGDAVKVHHVYLPGLSKSFVVWTAHLRAAGYYFLKRPSDPINFSAVPHDDVEMAGPFVEPKFFDAYETTTANVVLVTFTQPDGIWSFEFNFETDTMVSAPALRFSGDTVSLGEEAPDELLVTYMRSRGLQIRKTISGSERLVSLPSASDYIDLDTHRKQSASYIMHLAALATPNPEVARTFVADVDTEALYVSGFSDAPLILTSGNDSVGSVNPVSINPNVSHNIPAPIGEAARFNDVNLFGVGPWGFTYPGFTPNPNLVAISVWSRGNPNTLPRSTTAINGRTALNAYVVNVHFPWSNSNIYWDSGGDGGYDRINKVAIPGEFASPTFRNWIFTKSAVSGVNEIYLDGVLWHSAGGDTIPLGVIDVFRIGQNWEGDIAEVAWLEQKLGAPEAGDIFTNGPGYLNTTNYPTLAHLWTFDNDTKADALYDYSGNDRHLVLNGLSYNANGIQFSGDDYPYAQNIALGVGNTFEAWVTPKFSAYEAYVLYGTEVFFGYRNDRRLFFGFYEGGTRKLFLQTGGQRLKYGERNYVAAVHVFGSAASTMLVVNGRQIEGQWIEGVGDEDPLLSSIGVAHIRLGLGDLLHEWRASSTAKSLSAIQDYTKGRV